MTKFKKTSLLLILLLSIVSLQAQDLSIEGILGDKIRAENSQGAVVVEGIELYSQIELPKFYSNREFELAWTSQKNKRDLIESLESSYDEGLSPEDYHLEKIRKLMLKSEKQNLSKAEMADLDLLMTDALILYASHLLEGKLEQSELRKKWDVERNEGPADPDSLLTITLHNQNIKAVLEEFI
jgi:murein L,D-transpeptidase YcbB/YkuD